MLRGASAHFGRFLPRRGVERGGASARRRRPPVLVPGQCARKGRPGVESVDDHGSFRQLLHLHGRHERSPHRSAVVAALAPQQLVAVASSAGASAHHRGRAQARRDPGRIVLTHTGAADVRLRRAGDEAPPAGRIEGVALYRVLHGEQDADAGAAQRGQAIDAADGAL